jgi:ABC-type transport system involved in multi-copper enzyme maturation permease subunit
MPKVLLIARHTMQDQLKRRSFYVLLALSLFFVLTLRSCYDANYMVNGQPVSGVKVAWHASLLAFQFIATAMLMLSVLLATPVFPTDQEDGSMVLYLSRPVSRSQYLLGRLLGVWLLLSLFMLTLHATVFLIAWQKTGGMIPGYLTASLLCSANLLFAISLSSLFSFIMPGFVAAALSLAIIVFGFISDGGQQLLNSQLVQAVLSGAGTDVAWWRLLYPKLYMLQNYAVTLISGDEFHRFGPVHPLINVVLYCLVLIAVLHFIFARRDV